MPWSLFKKKELPLKEQQSTHQQKHRRLSSTFHVSTMSSMGDIVKSVSDANAAVNSREQAAAGSTTATATLESNPKLGTKRCMCCGTRLQYPENVPYFKCSICDTFHDVKKSSSSHSQDGIPINVDLVKATIETDNEDYSNLRHLLKSCFGSVIALNQSFPLTGTSGSSSSSKLSYSRPAVDFKAIAEFYQLISSLPSDLPMGCIIKSSIALLKRLRHSLDAPGDIVFILILLENPLLYKYPIFSAYKKSKKDHKHHPDQNLQPSLLELLERSIGILAHTPKVTRHYLLNWLSRFPVDRFEPKVALLNAYVAHRLTLHYHTGISGSSNFGMTRTNGSRHSRTTHSHSHSVTNNNSQTHHRHRDRNRSSLQVESHNGAAHREPGDRREHRSSPRAKKRRNGGSISHSSSCSSSRRIRPELYDDDWKIAAFIRVLAIYFNANTVSRTKIPISSFYNTMVDFTDVNSDFDGWQSLGVPTSTLSSHHFQHHHPNGSSAVGGGGSAAAAGNHRDPNMMPIVKSSAFNGFDFSISHQPKVAFCQYPFLLSMGSKTRILEYDARRQMEHKAQEAFFGALDNRCAMTPYLYIRVRRQHILQDSFDAFEQYEGDLKKGLRVEFIGEPGVDAGGLRKEWFLLLIRELFDPKTGIFVEDEESHYCWFDSNTAHPLKYYKLIGVAIGLALYNSIILDVNLPPVLFKKLLGCGYTLTDFTQFKPSFGKSLQHVLDYDGDEEEIFGLAYCITIKDKHGNPVEEPLTPNGQDIPVTKSNRSDYVRRVINYYLESSVRLQFEAFKQGFYNAVGGNALTLFRPEEIELLVRGSPEPVDVDALKSVTKYQHWGTKHPEDHVVIQWFWDYFNRLDPEQQRKLMMFVTGSDRIPATGVTNMTFKISNLGPDIGRLPTSHTCFNQLCLYEYGSKEKLEHNMDNAINNSQGFGIK